MVLVDISAEDENLYLYWFIVENLQSHMTLVFQGDFYSTHKQ